MTQIPFNHVMAAHCESGTVAALLNHHGLKIPEPLVFGISGAIFFGYFRTPMIDFPIFVVRSKPGDIRKKFAERTGIRFYTKTYSDPGKAGKELDMLLERGQPVAVQVDFFYMNYFPSWHRVHINVHFVTIIGREGNKYLVSDSYHPQITELDRDSLMKGRFAGGAMAPKGFIFYPVRVPERIDMRQAVIGGIKSATFNMLKIPLPFLGVRGIRRFADKITEWPGYARDENQLADKMFRITVLLEDQGTGGGGFRFLYASFLQEAAKILNYPVLNDFSKEIMKIGDGWREISLAASKIAKNRDFGREKFLELSKMISHKADLEETFFRNLRKEITATR